MDIDIDVQNRNNILEKIQHVRALSSDCESPHNVGIYIQNIPYNPRLGTAAIPYKKAEELGFFKIDILNNSIYEKIRDEKHLEELMKEPPWELFEHKEIVQQLAHIHNHFSIVKKMKPKSVEELAMVIAMIRPAKRYLVGKNWDKIKEEIWIQSEDEYGFKKSHSIAYSLSIVVQLNLLLEKFG